MTQDVLGRTPRARSPVADPAEPSTSQVARSTAPGVPDGGTAPRGYRAVRLVLFAVQVLMTTVVAGRSFFFSDDLMYGSLLGGESLDGALLFRSWFGHLVPGFIAADWAFYRYIGTNWGVAAVIMIAVALAAMVAMVRLLEALCGRDWRSLTVGALFGLSLMVVTQAMWWGAVMTNLVPLAASIGTVGSFVRWVRTGRARHLAGMTACFVLAVSFYEKSVLTAATAGLVSLLVLDAGLPWRDRVRSTLRRWPAWVLLGGIALLDLGWYLSHDFMDEAGVVPGSRDTASFLFHSFTEGFAPSAIGVHQPGVNLFGSHLLTLLVANGLLLGLAVVTSLRSRVALQAWVFFGLSFLLNQGVLARGRLAILGPHMGTLLRYQLENAFLFAVAVAVAVPYLRGVLPERWVPRLRGRRVSAWVVLGLCVLLLAPYWVISARSEIAVSQGARSKAWFETVRVSLAEQLRTDPGLALVDGTVPPWLVYPQMAPFNRYERALALVLPDAPRTQTADRGLSIDDAGNVHPVAFRPAVALSAEDVVLEGDADGAAGTGDQLPQDANTRGICVPPGAQVRYELPAPLAERLWFVRLQYTAAADGEVRIVLHNGGAAPGLRMGFLEYETEAGAGRLVVAPGQVPVAGVAVEVRGSAEVCLQGLEIGSMEPER